MRVLFYILVAVNLVYLAWGLTRSSGPPESVAVDLPATADPLVLWSESDSNDGRGVPVSGGKGSGNGREAGARESVPGEIRCYRVGPFQAEDAARRLAGTGPQSGPTMKVRETREKRPSSYWVYLTGLGDQDLVESTVERLREHGVRDYYVETVGEYRNSISLGLYTYESRAAVRADEIRELGFEPAIRPNLRTVTEYWIDYAEEPGTSLPDYWWQGESGVGESPARMERDCP